MENYYIANEKYDREYIKSTWDMATGLQAVDSLTPSDYLKGLAVKNIDGELSNDEIEELLYANYKDEDSGEVRSRIKEADMVSNRIVKLLKSESFSFSVVTLKYINKKLFEDIYDSAGEFRNHNISKREAVLSSESVTYGEFRLLDELLKYDFEEERDKDYGIMDKDKIIKNITKFTSSVWQAHPFEEGNTRAIAVFIERYLNSKGFEVDNTLFEKHSKYFRNALVRSNYANVNAGIHSNNKHLEKFFENLLYKGKHVLRNRDLILVMNNGTKDN